MTTIRKCVVLGASVAVSAISFAVFAQDDLDDLLKDLEGDAAKPAAKAAAEPAAEPAAEQAEEPAAAEPAAAEPASAGQSADSAAEPAEGSPAETAKKVDEVISLLNDLASESGTAASGPSAAAASVNAADAELLANLRTTEKLRRAAHDTQAKREIAEARENMRMGAYKEAARHYGLALKLFGDGQSTKRLQKECSQGIAEGLYLAAMQEYDAGQYAEALALMEKARDMRHPRAGRMLEKWNAQDAKGAAAAVSDDYRHRLNDEDFKRDREQIRRHLRRGRQYLAVRDMKRALEECEIVLKADPYNQDAIRLRRAIQSKRQTILEQERVQARDGMIADVDEAWRPVYAVNAAQLNEASSETVKAQTGDDPERTVAQDIERRMKEMRLPTISFKPPATIIDAVDWFRSASKDYDRPDIPVEKRGFNFVLKTPQGAIKQAAAAQGDDEGFSSDDSGEGAGPSNGLDPIPTITASDITFHEALKLVCDSVDYKFIVRGPIVMVMQKDMSTAEILSRKYNVPESFMERVTNASDEMKQMGGFGSSGAKKQDESEESPDRDWKAFFEEMGVKWPEGSSIKHIKSLGKLYVRNTRENLAEFDKVLEELGGQPQLIEIEARFVEAEQHDLNSVGSEWILNSDYSLTDVKGLGKALGLKSGTWGTDSGSRTVSTENKTTTTSSGSKSSTLIANKETSTITQNRTIPSSSNGSTWISNPNGQRNIGINAFGGTSDQQNGNRYLSTTSNHISGESQSTNDQFMRVNAFLGEADLSMILHMLSQRSDTDLLSAPKVVTKSGENAVIKVVTEYIYPTDYDVQLQSSQSSSSSSGSGSGSSAILAVVEPQNFTMREVGVILDVTPTYSEANGGTIDLELKPQVVDEPTWQNYGMKIPCTGNPPSFIPSLAWLSGSALETMQDSVATLVKQNTTIAERYVNAGIESMNPSTITYYDAPMNQPFFHVRSIDSKVSITPGATVVMGGLITEQRKAMDDKIPFLGDLPYVGRLFRSHAEQTIKRNLLIFVTGRLITPAGRELSIGQEAADEADVKAAPKE